MGRVYIAIWSLDQVYCSGSVGGGVGCPWLSKRLVFRHFINFMASLVGLTRPAVIFCYAPYRQEWWEEWAVLLELYAGLGGGGGCPSVCCQRG